MHRVENTKIIKVDTENATATAEDGTILKADRIIVTAGAWVQQFMPHEAAALMPRQTYTVFLKAPPQFAEAWRSAPPFVDVGNHIDGYVLPPGHGCDLKFGSGLTRSTFNAKKLEQIVTEDEALFLKNVFGQAFSHIDAYEILRTRRCAYIFTSNDRFWSTKQGKAVIVSACSGHGYKFGSLIGLKLADLILDNDMNAFSDWLA